MAKLTDIQIKAWIKNCEYFDERIDGDGLYLSYRENFAIPIYESVTKSKELQDK
ncbi:MAG: hypothetical protein PHO08_09785 [Methylococcales bacterium]|nr:hypothetical protein [Methylococcales bacterium]